MNKTAMPWGRAGEYFSDWDEASLRVYIAENYGFDTSKKLATVIKDVSGMRVFNPVKEYLEGLPAWDGVLRVDDLLVDYLGAQRTPYVQAVTRKALVAAVARIYEPGIKFDYVLVLNGKQGIGKSELFKRLAGKWHSDSLAITDMRDKTAAEKLHLDKELEQVAIEQQTKAMEQDSRAGIVRKYLDTPIPEDWDKMSLSTRREWLNGSYIDVETMQLPKVQPRKRVSNIEIFVECFGKEASDLDNKQSRDITKIMSTIDGWEKSKRERISLYGQQCCYVKMT